VKFPSNTTDLFVCLPQFVVVITFQKIALQLPDFGLLHVLKLFVLFWPTLILRLLHLQSSFLGLKRIFELHQRVHPHMGLGTIEKERDTTIIRIDVISERRRKKWF
jgi:hypothetical protein